MTCARAGTCLSRAVFVAPHAGKTALNGSGTFIRQTIENDTLSWTEPETVRFARLETNAVQRPHFGPCSVSEVRMVPPNPFETTRKFDVAGVAVGVCDGKMAEGGVFELTVRPRFASQFRMPPQRNYQLGRPLDEIFKENSMAYIWLKNSPSCQVQRETALERVIFGNVPQVQQPLRFETPCGNRGNFNPDQGEERSCVGGSGVGKGTVKATVSASRKTRLAN